MKIRAILGALVLLLVSGLANASLIDRGNGMLYDDVLNVTWLQDANYAKTSGYDSDGLLIWSEAKAWAGNLEYGGLKDWRLPEVIPINGTSFNYGGSSIDLGGWGYDGTSDRGFNITSPNSELSYMYYVNLGLEGLYSLTGDSQPDFGLFGDGTLGGQNDIGLVKNLQSHGYWTGTDFHTPTSAWGFYFGWGSQDHQGVTNPEGAWAVRDGDVIGDIPPVPIPAAVWLFGTGLLGLIGFSKRRNQLTS